MFTISLSFGDGQTFHYKIAPNQIRRYQFTFSCIRSCILWKFIKLKNMKSFIIFASFIVFAIAFPQSDDSAAVVITNENNNIGVGEFQAR